MCGIFGVIPRTTVANKKILELIEHSQQRGLDSSGYVSFYDSYKVRRADVRITELVKWRDINQSKFLCGHSRLITNGMSDNQPVVRDGLIVVHNGIIVNSTEVWNAIPVDKSLEIDSEVILGIALHYRKTHSLKEVCEIILEKCEGTMSCALLDTAAGELALFSNNGSLYSGHVNNDFYFASEKYPLTKIGCKNAAQVSSIEIHPIPQGLPTDVEDINAKRLSFIPELGSLNKEESLLEYRDVEHLKRCTKCILPHTMPFITFDETGVCNYCTNYALRNTPKPFSSLENLVTPYRKGGEPDCLVPFSGGRDSSYGLHLIVKELKMKPITYTYDWGMVTDLGRRNISRMCSKLGVENIIVAANIEQKRSNIRKNLRAWMKSPNLGMISILTAGDKHFFRHIEKVKDQTGLKLNLWGVNPLEITHFKSGFLGVPPDFHEEKVYSSNMSKQMNYQRLRLAAMLKSPGYFNESLWDTISGEYYRSFRKKEDYFHLFDFWRWDEQEIDNTLIEEYNWETAEDTQTTWRIGDGTAAFYNYIYYTVAGFTEHDTFRSNQIRENQLTREEALELVKEENRPRYPNIKWYLDAIGMDFTEVIDVVNSIPKLK